MRSVGHRYHVGNPDITPSLEESITGGGFASSGMADEVPAQSMVTWADIDEMWAAEQAERESRPELTITYDEPVAAASLSDPNADLRGIVVKLPNEALILLCNHPDVCGANADRVLWLASEELVRRLERDGRLPAA